MADLTREQLDTITARCERVGMLGIQTGDMMRLVAMARAYLDSRDAHVTHSCLCCEQTARERDTFARRARRWEAFARRVWTRLDDEMREADSLATSASDGWNALHRANASLARCREVLRGLEWSEVYYVTNDDPRWGCPVCRALKEDGKHEADCALRAALEVENG